MSYDLIMSFDFKTHYCLSQILRMHTYILILEISIVKKNYIKDIFSREQW